MEAHNDPAAVSYKVVLKLRLDWSEMDLFGHINNVMFMKYIQAARVNYWEQLGLYRHFTEEKCGPMLLSTSCRFRKPLFYPGEIVLRSKMDFIRNSSFGISHRLFDPAGELAAEAEDVMVMYDFKKDEKILFPAELRKNASELEGLSF